MTPQPIAPGHHAGAYAYTHAIRLNVGQPQYDLVRFITLGLLVVGTGWGATSLITTLVSARSLVSAPQAALFVLFAVSLRLLFFKRWRVRRARARLVRETRARLDAVLASGHAPDAPTLCWCIAVAAGCTNLNPRRLTLARLERIESQLGVHLPRQWIFDPWLQGALALPVRESPVAPARYPVLRPTVSRAVVGVVSLIVLVGLVPPAIAMIVASLASSPAAALVVVACLVAIGVFVLALHLWARSRDRSVEVRPDGSALLHRGRSALAPPLATHAPDDLRLTFPRFVRSAPKHRWRLERERRHAEILVRFLAPAPWIPVDICLAARQPEEPIRAPDERRTASARR